ncbi:hypothetical protein IQ22_01907 [Pseudomonas duriflava]|uniref:Uncharacterized protein n=1 Tax=Pseudomonas duriflava TaxID=459528 RepID=A0A562QG36_9PSED|nr:hypothetical protein [Pseudomonas duriflava]TWI54996.1 hypothetical protein IQ22_01907 [Pseudomonas duriflava]
MITSELNSDEHVLGAVLDGDREHPLFEQYVAYCDERTEAMLGCVSFRQWLSDRMHIETVAAELAERARTAGISEAALDALVKDATGANLSDATGARLEQAVEDDEGETESLDTLEAEDAPHGLESQIIFLMTHFGISKIEIEKELGLPFE